MPRPLVAANWKMHTTLAEARGLAAAARKGVEAFQGVEVVLFPPFPYLPEVKEVLEGSPVLLGAQNMHPEEKGAFTGEVSPLMVAEFCDFVLIGHSERRAHFCEDDVLIHRKVKAALAHGLRPILCVGERLEDRRAGQAEEVVRGQLEAALEGVEYALGMAIAYEPVWAIGTGVPATPQEASEMSGEIFRVLAVLLGEHQARDIPVLYGGSVSAESIEGFVESPWVHGALVGGASLKAEEFVEIVRRTARAKGLL